MPAFRTGYPRLRLGLSTRKNSPPSPWPIEWDVLQYQQAAVDMWTPAVRTDVVIQRTGLYLCTGGIAVAALLTSLFSALNVTRNGTSIGGQRQVTNGAVVQVNVNTVAELQQGDVLQLVAFTNGADILAAPQTLFTVTRIGPERWTGGP